MLGLLVRLSQVKGRQWLKILRQGVSSKKKIKGWVMFGFVKFGDILH
jgi:hypothetical protein